MPDDGLSMFLSFSHDDLDLAQGLHRALQAGRGQVWADWETVAATAAWTDEIHRAVARADLFVALISPEYLLNASCQEEIALAAHHRKRVLAFCTKSLPRDCLPAGIADADIAVLKPPRADADLHDAVWGVLGAVECADGDAIRSHTRLLLAALQWDRDGRPRWRLPDAPSATERRSRCNLSDLQVAFLDESDRARQGRRARAALCAVVALVALVGMVAAPVPIVVYLTVIVPVSQAPLLLPFLRRRRRAPATTLTYATPT
ncbi:TIR domain-containing protein [Plasmodiophora brassicae]